MSLVNAGSGKSSGDKAKSPSVVVDPAQRLGQLNRFVFGGFVEHLGRCIDGGLFEEGSPLSDKRGFRLDVLDLLRPLKLSVLRWPGGNFVSNYHWTDGVGTSQHDRPAPTWPGAASKATISAPTSSWPIAPSWAWNRTSV